MASLSALSPVNYIGLYLGYGFTGLVNWFFEPSQLHRVISGLWFHSVSLCFEPSQRHRVISGLWFHSVSLCFEPSQRHRVISGLWLHWGNSCCLHPWGKFGLAVVIVFVCWCVWWFVCVRVLLVLDVLCVCGRRAIKGSWAVSVKCAALSFPSYTRPSSRNHTLPNSYTSR